MSPCIVIALGSNIDAQHNLAAAAMELRAVLPDCQFSSVYRTEPLDFEEQDDFLNAVAVSHLERTPDELARELKRIEEALHKAPPFKNGPRTIDLDLLLVGTTVQEGQITLPHPRMHLRRFVLEPLCELIDPHAHHPVLDVSWEKLLEDTLDQRCEMLQMEL